MNCEEARRTYALPLVKARPDKLKEAIDHINSCFECQKHFRLKHKKIN